MTQNPFNPSTSGLQPTAGNTGTPGAITATSASTNAITIGVLSFQVPPQAAWAPGMFISAVDANNPDNWIWGTVNTYSGSTLTINVQQINGAGTPTSWLINLSGASSTEGAQGPAGTPGTAGAPGGPMNGKVQGLKIVNDSSTPSTKIDISAVAATMVTSTGTSIRATGVLLTLDLTAGTSSAAANGMDGEARGTSAWIYLYLINNGTTTATLATKTSPLSGAPTLPSGYTYYSYVGAMYVDSSGNLLRTLQLGNKAHYVVTASTNTPNLPVMGNGSAGSTSTPTWVGITLAGFVPPTADTINVAANADVGGTAAVVLVAPNNAYGNGTSTNPPPVVVGTATTAAINPVPIESSSIYWASSGTDGYLFCLGWTDYVATA